MKKLLDVTDRRVRLLQHVSLLMSFMLLLGGIATLTSEAVPRGAAVAAIVLGTAFVIMSGGIRQRWEIEYRGHCIRFENSAVTAEKLYIDEGLVARGGLGFKMELRAPIRVGEGAGEELMVLADAGFTAFRIRIFVENDGSEIAGTSVSAAPMVVQARQAPAYATATADPRPVIETSVIGRLVLAKQAVETASAIMAVLGGLGTIILWIF